MLSATITSQRLAFGRGIQIGAAKAAFCKAYGLNPRYDGYRILGAPEGSAELSFHFSQGVLSSVSYQINYLD